MGYAGAGMAMNVAGALVKMGAAIKANKKMGSTFKGQIGEQKGFRTQAMAPLAGLYKTSTAQTADRQIGEGSAARQAGYARTTTPMATPTYASQSTPQDAAYGKLVGASRGNLGGYSDWALRQAMNNLQAQRTMDQATNFAQGSAGVFPLQMYDAQHSGDTWAMIGELLQAAGGASANYGLSQPPRIKGEPGSVG